MKKLTFKLISLVFLFGGCLLITAQSSPKPNVIFILADDQGYGDMAINGNPLLKTPHIDELGKEGIYLTNFHTETTCSPTRAGLMTGQYANKVGVWHTVKGRELLDRRFMTIGQAFNDGGYATGIFGKWHLGDYEGYRPDQRGFDEAFVCRGGGVSQIADFWNNDYFGDTYFRNGKPEKITNNKFCTDVWFDNAFAFITKKSKQGQPFFCYIPTNAAHSPYFAPQQYLDMYQNKEGVLNAAFYGMITNIDHNLGRLQKLLRELNIADNTILVYTSDNGSTLRGPKEKAYNSGLRGRKGSEYEGGHRLPLFIYWKDGKLTGGKRLDELTSYVDLMPTLLDLCGIKVPKNLDGVSLENYLYNKPHNLKERVIVSNTQRQDSLQKWKNTSIMKEHWRLITNAEKVELYNLETDWGQQNNIVQEHPEVVKNLKDAYEDYWANISVNAHKYNLIPVEPGKEAFMTADDCHESDGAVAWTPYHVRNGEGAKNGFWTIDVREAGYYTISLRRYPKETNLAINDPAPEGDPVPGTSPSYPPGKILNFKKASILMNGKPKKEKMIKDNPIEINFNTKLSKGMLKLNASFIDDKAQRLDAYYVYINKTARP
ncbi:Arylsulfatase A [Salegentibacter agarivorans]|uniref:Arylsulfatase A n=1 Tax=Salegentibacter agarivorans TaxID=345907 RepID=A0A1I2KSR9_9FLAO|nr:arylsulfatase [Salegentibacter agarivorans]SFF68141.1 Arylsulfatase A [Salegentibacter agarivorans]